MDKSGSLIPMDIFLQKAALLEMAKIENRLRAELGEIQKNLAVAECVFMDILKEISEHRGPLEYEISVRKSKIIELKVSNNIQPCAANMDNFKDMTEREGFKELYRSIVKLLAKNGYFLSPELIVMAREALMKNNFHGLYMAYEKALKIARGENEMPFLLLSGDDTKSLDKKREQIALLIKRLESAIGSARHNLRIPGQNVH